MGMGMKRNGQIECNRIDRQPSKDAKVDILLQKMERPMSHASFIGRVGALKPKKSTVYLLPEDALLWGALPTIQDAEALAKKVQKAKPEDTTVVYCIQCSGRDGRTQSGENRIYVVNSHVEFQPKRTFTSWDRAVFEITRYSNPGQEAAWVERWKEETGGKHLSFFLEGKSFLALACADVGNARLSANIALVSASGIDVEHVASIGRGEAGAIVVNDTFKTVDGVPRFPAIYMPSHSGHYDLAYPLGEKYAAPEAAREKLGADIRLA